MDTTTYQIVIFGKAGCDKCKMLNKRVEKILKKKQWQDFHKVYHDIMTEDGLIDFANAECINPQRIPAMLVMHKTPESDEFVAVANPAPGRKDSVCGGARLYQYQGLQTDYTEAGRGIISPAMIKAVLDDALAS